MLHTEEKKKSYKKNKANKTKQKDENRINIVQVKFLSYRNWIIIKISYNSTQYLFFLRYSVCIEVIVLFRVFHCFTFWAMFKNGILHCVFDLELVEDFSEEQMKFCLVILITDGEWRRWEEFMESRGKVRLCKYKGSRISGQRRKTKLGGMWKNIGLSLLRTKSWLKDLGSNIVNEEKEESRHGNCT